MSIKMTEEEMRSFIEEWAWGTIIAVEGDKPYAIEVSYGSDGKYLYFGSRPKGRMAKCIALNQNIIFKICDADRYYNTWRAVSVFGKVERLTKREDIIYGMKMIAHKVINVTKKTSVTEKQFVAIGEAMAAHPEAGGPLRLPIDNLTGKKREKPLDITSAASG
jgi:nitroimidazol reductase NimA-like FMN-containing flavoprotein (pyridoxamine 5'-phosphate oxidase superfamily)